MFNSDQRDYMASLAKMDPATKCWCGWFPLSECRCERDTQGKTSADRIAAACPSCGNDPFAPGRPVVHTIKCPEREE